MTKKVNIRSVIEKKFSESLAQTGSSLSVPKLDDNVVLLESGLDSLGFAILVALLEDDLGYDPFSMMNNAVYPKTYGDFVAIYEKMSPN